MSASRTADLGLISAFAVDLLSGCVIPMTSKLVPQCQTPGVMGPWLGLTGLVSVYNDCVRWKF